MGRPRSFSSDRQQIVWQLAGTAEVSGKRGRNLPEVCGRSSGVSRHAGGVYDAAWRWAALIEIYKTDGDEKKSGGGQVESHRFGAEMAAQFTHSDWGSRAQRLLYLIDQKIPAYGNATE